MINFSEIFNYPIYEVGGCVRDALLNVSVKDIDIASDLPPEDFKALCKKLNFRTHDTGIEHGTVTVVIKGVPYEHTTFRKDVSCDGRNATIEFSKTIEEDLSRRDFTINAIARLGDKIIDPFNGREDLNNKVLRTVGNAEERFSEDYLRIIRAARFISRLNLTADEELLSAAVKMSPFIIKYVSIERITDEIRKTQAHGKRFFQEAETLGFLKHILPEVKELQTDERNNWLSLIERAQIHNELIYFASILIPICNDKAESRAASLKMSRQISKGIGTLYKHKDAYKSELSPALLRDLIVDCKDYYEDLKTFGTNVYHYDQEVKKNLAQTEKFEQKAMESINSPYINGAFLIKNGLKPSPAFKEILDDCGRLQASGVSEEEIQQKALEKIRAAL